MIYHHDHSPNLVHILAPLFAFLFITGIVSVWISRCIRSSRSSNQEDARNINDNTQQISSTSVRLTVEQMDRLYPAKPYQSVVLEMMETGQISSSNNNNNNIDRTNFVLNINGTENLSQQHTNSTNQFTNSIPNTTVNRNAFGSNNLQNEYLNSLQISCALCCKNFKQSEPMGGDLNQNIYKQEENVRVLPCNHMFHDNCISEFLITSRVFECPVCERKL